MTSDAAEAALRLTFALGRAIIADDKRACERIELSVRRFGELAARCEADPTQENGKRLQMFWMGILLDVEFGYPTNPKKPVIA